MEVERNSTALIGDNLKQSNQESNKPGGEHESENANPAELK
jgi:hypothetical protein